MPIDDSHCQYVGFWARVGASRMATVGAAGVHSMSSRQARPSRTFITLLAERPAKKEVVERPFAAWRGTVVMIASLSTSNNTPV